jgi:tetratricopeptide (TPR) repeat protein
MSTPRGCPDDSVLAAFAEGTLADDERLTVEQHVADCPECPGVIGETVRFLRDGGDEGSNRDEPPPRSWWRIAAAAAILVLCLPAAFWLVANRDPLSNVREIAEALPTRPVEGRLASFDHAPFEEFRSGGLPRGETIALRAAAERLRNANAPHARGIALLLAGDVANARRELEAAAQAEPRNAAIWNDLAVAHIAAGRTGGRTDYEQALTAADRAIALDRSLAGPHFNRGVTLAHLGRGTEAADAYRRATALEPTSPWSDEAALRMSR